MKLDHNVTARRQANAFAVVFGIPDAQQAARCVDDISDHDARNLTRLTTLVGGVAHAVASSGDIHGALIEMSKAAHGWMDDIQQNEAR